MFDNLKIRLSALAVTLGAVVSLMATPALAAPVTWTIPATALSSGGSISGTFVFDAALPEANRLVSINVVETGPHAAAHRFVGRENSLQYFGQSDSFVTVGNTSVISIKLDPVPSMGAVNYLVPVIVTGTCQRATGGKCDLVTAIGQATNVTISSAAPAAVPTMSEWAMILMGVLLAGGAAVVVQRRRLAV